MQVIVLTEVKIKKCTSFIVSVWCNTACSTKGSFLLILVDTKIAVGYGIWTLSVYIYIIHIYIYRT